MVNNSAESKAQVEVMFRMLAGALGVPLEGDPEWFREKAPRLAVDFESKRATDELAKMLDTEMAELRRLRGMGNGNDK